MSNLEIWNKVETTDKKFTKAITGKQYKGTSPNPTYLAKKATEVFGPCGIGWGVKVLSERIETFNDINRLHILHVKFWYVLDGVPGEFEHFGHTVLTGNNKNGFFVDEDAPKKSMTDAMVKAMSLLGFAADIFMGQFDDVKYQAQGDDILDEPKKPEAKQEPKKANPENAAAAFLSGLELLVDGDSAEKSFDTIKANADKLKACLKYPSLKQRAADLLAVIGEVA